MGDGASATAILPVALRIDGREWAVETRIVRGGKRRKLFSDNECTEVSMAVGIKTTAW